VNPPRGWNILLSPWTPLSKFSASTVFSPVSLMGIEIFGVLFPVDIHLADDLLRYEYGVPLRSNREAVRSPVFGSEVFAFE